MKYLKSILPNILVLNGDIIGSWRSSRNYFPKNHLKVVRQIIKMMEKAVCHINCGDWVENFTAAEYNDGKWRLFFQTDLE